jgi:hypothetical protein
MTGETMPVLTAGAVLRDVPAIFGLEGLYGKHVFASGTGGLTVARPESGLAPFNPQDFILSVGVTMKNPSTGTTDIIINPRLIGRLA